MAEQVKATDHPSGRVKGECIKWITKKGFGFIKMDDGDEFFVHSSELQDDDTDQLERGDRVEFEVEVNPNTNKTKAVQVTVIEDDQTFEVDDEEHKGVVKMYHQQKGYGIIHKYGQTGQGKDARFEMKDAGFAAGDAVTFQLATGSRGKIEARNVTLDASVTRERVKGECVKWNNDKGFGFVKTDEGQDVFVHRSNIQGGDALERLNRVEFEIGVNPKNQKPHAVRVKVIEDEREPETFDVDDEQHKGVVQVYFPEKGFGMLREEGEEKNLRFNMKDAEFAPGDAVFFQIATGTRGHLQARNVSIDPDVTRERVKGECVSWNDKGFGFIKTNEEEIFVHSNNIQGADTLDVGDRVEFEVHLDTRKGKKLAVRLTKIEEDASSKEDSSEEADQEMEEKSENSKKRKLDNSEDEVASPPSKKRKTNDGAAAFLSEEDSDEDESDESDDE